MSIMKYSKRHNKLLFPALVKAINASFYKPEKAISNVVNYKKTEEYTESIRNYDVMEHKFEKELRWDDLVEEYQTMLYRIAFSNMKNRADAEDVVQEAFLRYMKDEKPILNREHEKAWLIRTTIHICMDILKSSWHRRTVALDESLTAETRSVWLPYQIKDDRTLEAVLQLPVHYRNPIYLFYYEDYSIQEIAGVLNEKEGTIKTRLRRGREEVKKILTEGRP